MDQNFEFVSDRMRKDVIVIKSEPSEEEEVTSTLDQTSDQDMNVAEDTVESTLSSAVSVTDGTERKTTDFKSIAFQLIDHDYYCVSQPDGKTIEDVTQVSPEIGPKPIEVKVFPHMASDGTGFNKSTFLVKAVKCAIDGCPKVYLNLNLLREHRMAVHNLMLKPFYRVDNRGKTRDKSQPRHVPLWSEVPSISFVDSHTGYPNDCIPKPIIKTALNDQTRQVLVNLKHYFHQRNPNWQQGQVIQEISKASMISPGTVRNVIYHYKKHGAVKTNKIGKRKPVFVCTDADREILAKCIDKLKNENKLNGVNDIYLEINRNNELNPSFKGCLKSTFYRIFNKSGFKITETMIINEKPISDNQLTKVDGLWHCVWPGCDKKYKERRALSIHTRTHTQEKPYACRRPGCSYRCTQYANLMKHLKVHKITVIKNVSIERTDSDNDNEIKS